MPEGDRGGRQPRRRPGGQRPVLRPGLPAPEAGGADRFLPDTLEDLAQRQEEESLRRIDRTVGAIEPAIVVITSALAGVILLSVMLPLMGLLSTIG